MSAEPLLPPLPDIHAVAAQMMQGLCANPGGPFQANDRSGWGFVNCTADDIAETAYALADALLKHGAARSAQAAAQGWLPIESAPKIGFILAVNADEGWVEQARWDADRREWWSINTYPTDAYGSPIYPTHYQPLPAPPQNLIAKE